MWFIVKKIPKFCGVKLSLCCTIISVWGTVHLGIMGLMFFLKSVTLLEACEPETKGPPSVVLGKIYERYEANAVRCGIASGLYFLTFIISIVQFFVNLAKPKKDSESDPKKRTDKKKKKERQASSDDFEPEEVQRGSRREVTGLRSPRKDSIPQKKST